jgi:DnaD/phage-associated family protein
VAKEAYYFSHDSNARHDPKITAMRGVYGSEGYGWWWMLVEMMREADEYKLDIKSKYAFNAYAMQLQCECNAIASFVHDCINEFNLFSSDGEYFWSESLLRRMEIRDVKSKKARESANARWKKQQKDANALDDDANASKMDALKESKRKEIKGKENIKDTTTTVNPFRLFESEGFGTLSATLGEKIGDFIDDYSERWVCEAMKEAAYYQKRNLPYVKSILDRYKTSGIDEPWNRKEGVNNGGTQSSWNDRTGGSNKTIANSGNASARIGIQQNESRFPKGKWDDVDVSLPAVQG